jgi:hypothetical protein
MSSLVSWVIRYFLNPAVPRLGRGNCFLPGPTDFDSAFSQKSKHGGMKRRQIIGSASIIDRHLQSRVPPGRRYSQGGFMQVGWAGLLTLAALITQGHPMDVDVNFSEQTGAAHIRIFHVPAKEPLGAVKLRLKLRPEAGLEAMTILEPAAGPWSQFMPQAVRSGNTLTLWAMAPNIGESRDSSAKLIFDVNLVLAAAKPMALAADLIDSVVVEEAWTPFGQKTVLAKNLTTGLRSAPGTPGSNLVERMRGSTRSLDFNLGKAQRVRVYVSDFRGRRMADILDKKLAAGMHEVTWDGKADGGGPLPAGTYFLRLEAGTYAYDRKLEVAK